MQPAGGSFMMLLKLQTENTGDIDKSNKIFTQTLAHTRAHQTTFGWQPFFGHKPLVVHHFNHMSRWVNKNLWRFSVSL